MSSSLTIPDSPSPIYTTSSQGAFNTVDMPNIGTAYVTPDVYEGLRRCGYPDFTPEQCPDPRYKASLKWINSLSHHKPMFISSYDYSNPDCLIERGNDKVVEISQCRVEQKCKVQVSKLKADISANGVKYPCIAVWVDGKIYIAIGNHRAEALLQLGLAAPLILVTEGSREQRIALLCDLANLSNAESAMDVRTDKPEDITHGAKNYLNTIQSVDTTKPHLQDKVRLEFKRRLQNAAASAQDTETVRKEIIGHFLKTFKTNYYKVMSQQAKDAKVTLIHNTIFSADTHPQLEDYSEVSLEDSVNIELNRTLKRDFDSSKWNHHSFSHGNIDRFVVPKLVTGRQKCIDENNAEWMADQGAMIAIVNSAKKLFDEHLVHIKSKLDYFTNYNKGLTTSGKSIELFIDGKWQNVKNPLCEILVFPKRFNDDRDNCWIYEWDIRSQSFLPRNGQLPQTQREIKLQREQEAELAALAIFEVEDWDV